MLQAKLSVSLEEDFMLKEPEKSSLEHLSFPEDGIPRILPFPDDEIRENKEYESDEEDEEERESDGEGSDEEKKERGEFDDSDDSEEDELLRDPEYAEHRKKDMEEDLEGLLESLDEEGLDPAQWQRIVELAKGTVYRHKVMKATPNKLVI